MVRKTFEQFKGDSTAYHRQQTDWIYPDICNIHMFLADWQEQLTRENLEVSIDKCDKYLNSGMCNPHKIYLILGAVSLELQGADEMDSATRGLKAQYHKLALNDFTSNQELNRIDNSTPKAIRR